MLSAKHKAQILTRVGLTVPPCPAPPAHIGTGAQPTHHQARGDSSAHEVHKVQAAAKGKDGSAEAAWRRQIDILYAQYAAERAAKSLRQAEEAEQLARLRKANCR